MTCETNVAVKSQVCGGQIEPTQDREGEETSNDSESRYNVPFSNKTSMGGSFPCTCPTHARKAERPMTTRPTAEAATCTVDASPLRLLLVVEFEFEFGSELEPEAVAWAANVEEDEDGYGPGTQEGINLCGVGGPAFSVGTYCLGP